MPTCQIGNTAYLDGSVSLPFASPPRSARRLLIGPCHHLLSSSLQPVAQPRCSSILAIFSRPWGDLPEWLLFNPSYLEVRSPTLGHLSNASLVPSFTEVVKGEGAVVEDPKGKAPLDPAL
jgi:hypothetical protein